MEQQLALLSVACYDGDLEACKTLLSEIHEVNVDSGTDDADLLNNWLSTDPRCALYYACGEGYLEIVQLFVMLGVDIHCKNNLMLQRACSSNEGLHVAEYLVMHGADAKAITDFNSGRDSDPCCDYGLALLLQHGGDATAIIEELRKRDEDIRKPFHGPVDWVKLPRFIIKKKYLRAFYALYPNHFNPITALVTACEFGIREVAKYVLENGGDVHAEKELALREAVRNGHVDTVYLLFAYGADIHTTYWGPPLRTAVKRDHYKIVDVILSCESNRYTPLEYDSLMETAAMFDAFESITILLRHGFVLRPDALRGALYQRSRRMVKLLINAGAPMPVPYNDSPHQRFPEYFWEMFGPLIRFIKKVAWRSRVTHWALRYRIRVELELTPPLGKSFPGGVEYHKSKAAYTSIATTTLTTPTTKSAKCTRDPNPKVHDERPTKKRRVIK